MSVYLSPCYYPDYLKLDTLLNAQELRSEKVGDLNPEEMLFIVTHQSFELWFKQMLFDLDLCLSILAKKTVNDQDLRVITKRINRMTQTFQMLSSQLHLLETMSPEDFLEFRDLLSPASGFQSYQFRLLEIKWGLDRDKVMTAGAGKKPFHYRLQDAHLDVIEQAKKGPNLTQLLISWLERNPYCQIHFPDFWSQYESAVKKMLLQEKDKINVNPYLNNDEKQFQLKLHEKLHEDFLSIFHQDHYHRMKNQQRLQFSYSAFQSAIFIKVYREKEPFHWPHNFLSSLSDLAQNVNLWRNHHAHLAKRMLGTKTGTGGSLGFDYLIQTVKELTLWDDLSHLTTYLIPAHLTPPYPL